MAAIAAFGLGVGCASASSVGPTLTAPAEAADRLRGATSVEEPARIRFRWEYGDEQGTIRGDGLARVNPPDSFRLDLFTSGEGSMAVALAADRLSTLGQIEDLELPTPPFMYAMAGLFRPGSGAPVEGVGTESSSTLTFEAPDARRRFYTFEGDRLVRLEERAGGRATQRIRLVWGEGAWPTSAEYRDLERPRRVEWHLEEVAEEGSRFPVEIFELEGDG